MFWYRFTSNILQTN